jgi:hypothetical protein
MFWKLLVVGFMTDTRIIRDLCRLKLSTLIEPAEGDKNFLNRLVRPHDPETFTLKEILEKRAIFQHQYSEKSGYDERPSNNSDNEMVLNITEFFHKMKLLNKLESDDVSILDKMAAIEKYERDVDKISYTPDLKRGGLMKDW